MSKRLINCSCPFDPIQASQLTRKAMMQDLSGDHHRPFASLDVFATPAPTFHRNTCTDHVHPHPVSLFACFCKMLGVNKPVYPWQKESETLISDRSLGLATLDRRRLFATTVAALHQELYHIPHKKLLRETLIVARAFRQTAHQCLRLSHTTWCMTFYCVLWKPFYLALLKIEIVCRPCISVTLI